MVACCRHETKLSALNQGYVYISRGRRKLWKRLTAQVANIRKTEVFLPTSQIQVMSGHQSRICVLRNNEEMRFNERQAS